MLTKHALQTLAIASEADEAEARLLKIYNCRKVMMTLFYENMLGILSPEETQWGLGKLGDDFDDAVSDAVKKSQRVIQEYAIRERQQPE